MRFKLMILFFLLLATSGRAQYTEVVVGKAGEVNSKILINEMSCSDTRLSKRNFVREKVAAISKIITNDFLFYKEMFSVLSKQEDKSLLGKAKFYLKEGANYLIEITCSKKNKVEKAQLHLYDLRREVSVVEKEISFMAKNLRGEVHKVADTFFFHMTKRKSLFLSKIAFVADQKTSLKSTRKELFVMDFDGFNRRKITSHQGIVISPAFSMDNKKILYSLIDIRRRKNNIALYEYNLETGKKRIISNRNGINSGAIYTADGRGIYLTLSYSGNADIYYMNLKTKAIRRVTFHSAVDVDPSINKGGGILTFLSGRAGRAMIYTMNPLAGARNLKRISYVGKFNATPRFSPSGEEIVFASWLDNTFDLFRISATGRGLVRLTKKFGSNENPSYSPDGMFITFSSKRVITRVKADQDIYIMTRDGRIIGRLTQGLGKCSTPVFSN